MKQEIKVNTGSKIEMTKGNYSQSYYIFQYGKVGTITFKSWQNDYSVILAQESYLGRFGSYKEALSALMN